MNHIPMSIEPDRDLDWVSSQAAATCNIEHSLFNDWFTGHLNFQLEHQYAPSVLLSFRFISFRIVFNVLFVILQTAKMYIFALWPHCVGG
jgi:hypothetical protein